MEKLVVVVVNSETKAYEASQALKELDREGSISIYAEAVLQKNANGTVTFKESADDFPIRTVAGTAIGSMIGLLGGPVGVGIGAVAGTLAGGFSDLYQVGVSADFLDDVSATLKPGKFAIVADISEEWIMPLDLAMEKLGAESLLRSPKASVEAAQRAREIATLRAEIEEYKAEQAHARAERKAKLQAKIDKLNAELDAKVEQAKLRAEQMKSETDAKVQALHKKAAKAQAAVKNSLNARAQQIRHDYEEKDAQLRNVVATKLRAAAAKVEQHEPVHH